MTLLRDQEFLTTSFSVLGSSNASVPRSSSCAKTISLIHRLICELISATGTQMNELDRSSTKSSNRFPSSGASYAPLLDLPGETTIPGELRLLIVHRKLALAKSNRARLPQCRLWLSTNATSGQTGAQLRESELMTALLANHIRSLAFRSLYIRDRLN